MNYQPLSSGNFRFRAFLVLTTCSAHLHVTKELEDPVMDWGPLSLGQIPAVHCSRPELCPSVCSVMGLKCKDLTLEGQR